jgi:hypothetical protein
MPNSLPAQFTLWANSRFGYCPANRAAHGDARGFSLLGLTAIVAVLAWPFR